MIASDIRFEISCLNCMSARIVKHVHPKYGVRWRCKAGGNNYPKSLYTSYANARQRELNQIALDCVGFATVYEMEAIGE